MAPPSPPVPLVPEVIPENRITWVPHATHPVASSPKAASPATPPRNMIAVYHYPRSYESGLCDDYWNYAYWTPLGLLFGG